MTITNAGSSDLLATSAPPRPPTSTAPPLGVAPVTAAPTGGRGERPCRVPQEALDVIVLLGCDVELARIRQRMTDELLRRAVLELRRGDHLSQCALADDIEEVLE